MTLKDKGRNRKSRKSRYGYPLTQEAKVHKTYPAKKGNTTTSYPAPKYKAVSDETTPYGAKKFRTPTHENQFTGKTGSKQEAIILDIDGTLTSWGAGFDKNTLAWCEKHYKRNGDIVFVVVTARDHEYMYESSFNTLMRGFPYAFIGPFCRAKDDPRYASEFKRELCVDLSNIFDIVGAADDNKQVIDMWKQWAIDWFENPDDFDLLECSYGAYADWRGGLTSKGHSYPSSYVSTPSGGNTSHWKPANQAKATTGRKYINGTHDKTTNEWITGHYEGQVWVEGGSDPVTGNYHAGKWIDPPKDEAKHRAAGSDRFEERSLVGDPSWGHYLAKRYGSKGLNVISESPNGEGDALDEVMEELGGLTRADLEDITAHNQPGLTPAEIESMTMEDLRENAGITNDDYREFLYEEIAKKHGGHWADEELNEIDLDQVEQFLYLDRHEVDAILDETWAARSEINDGPGTVFTVEEQERQAKYQARCDLEDDVLASYDGLSLHIVQGMDTDVLRHMLSEALARENVIEGEVVEMTEADLNISDQPETAPLDVREILGDMEVTL